jgi:hypothetical protein
MSFIKGEKMETNNESPYEKQERKQNFLRNIMWTLRDDPDWLNESLSACAAGMNLALDEVRNRVSNAEVAYLSALSLMDGKRKSKEIISYLQKNLLEKIEEARLMPCALETSFIKSLGYEYVQKNK